MPSLQTPPVDNPFPQLSIGLIEGTARSVRYRQLLFHRLNDGLVKRRDQLVEALQDDFGFSSPEALFEYSQALLELRCHYDGISLADELTASKAITDGRKNANRSVGAGIVYIAPRPGLLSVVAPLCAAIAAGNCVVTELPHTTAKTRSILDTLLPGVLGCDTFAITHERPDASFLRQCIIVTQSCSPETPTACRSLIYSPSDKPSLFFVDRTADTALAARHLASAQFGFNATSSYAPDVVMVHEAVLGLISTHLIPAAVASSATGQPAGKRPSKDQGRDSVASLAELASVTLLFSGPGGAIVQTNDSTLSTLLRSRLVTESPVPLLLLCSVTSMDVAIDLSCDFDLLRAMSPKPAGRNPSAAFIFASAPDAQYIANSVDADLTCINNFPAQLMVGPRLAKSSLPAPADAVGGSLTPRYSRALFEEPRTVILPQSPAATFYENVAPTIAKKGRGSTFLSPSQSWTETVLAPLKPIRDREQTNSLIFDTGLLLTGAITVGIPLVVGLGFAGRYALGHVGRMYFG